MKNTTARLQRSETVGLAAAAASLLVLVTVSCTTASADVNGVPSQVEGISPIVLSAYGQAAAAAEEIAPECTGMTWSLLAAIGHKESRHGTLDGSSIGADGVAVPPIRGPELNGEGFAAIADTDQGVYDRNPVWDHAVGPMQFIPGTWEGWKVDGNGDGLFDPQNIYDATYTAVAYLCGRGPTDLTDAAELEARILAYNRDSAYVADVLAQKAEYDAIPVTGPMTAAAGPVPQLGDAMTPCLNMGQMHPSSCHAHQMLFDQFGVFYFSAGGVRGEPGSDHNNGQAIDYMLAPIGGVPTPEVQAGAVTIINWIIANHKELQVKGLIYDHHIWNATRGDPVGPWEEVRRFHQDTGSNTQDHVDHIHLACGPGDML